MHRMGCCAASSSSHVMRSACAGKDARQRSKRLAIQISLGLVVADPVQVGWQLDIIRLSIGLMHYLLGVVVRRGQTNGPSPHHYCTPLAGGCPSPLAGLTVTPYTTHPPLVCNKGGK